MVGSIPGSLSLVQSFLNTLDVEDEDADELASVYAFRGWLANNAAYGPLLADAARTATAADLQQARRLRAELRAELTAHHDGEPRERSDLNALAAEIPLRASISADGAVRLEPAAGGATAVLGAVLAATVLAAHDGSWRRMKVCPRDDCQGVYYDTSKNLSRRWCSMEVCGNREKTRAYRQRRREDAGPVNAPP